MEESSWARAGKDTDNFRSKRLWFLGVEVLGSGAIAGLASWMLWDKSTLKGWQVGLVTFLVFTIGLLVIYGLIYLWNLFRAPYHQRNEARELVVGKPEIPLSNRKSLIRAIATVKDKAIEVKMSRDRCNLKEKQHEDSRSEWITLTNTHLAYHDATKVLETERLIAGDPYKGIILGLLSFINYHVDDCMENILFENKPETVKTIPLIGLLDDYVEWAIYQLDAANSRVRRKGDSQI